MAETSQQGGKGVHFILFAKRRVKYFYEGPSVHPQDILEFRFPPNFPPLPIPARVTILHPAHNSVFIDLPAYDQQAGSDLYGIHYETILTACTILAFNQPGFFSRDQGRDSERIEADSILPAGEYFYHLQDPTLDVSYPICRDFRNWDFPHEKMPMSWEREPNMDTVLWPTSWAPISTRVKFRDKTCLVSGFEEGLTIAHIIPEAEIRWVCARATLVLF